MSGACQNFLSCLIFCILLSSELVGKHHGWSVVFAHHDREKSEKRASTGVVEREEREGRREGNRAPGIFAGGRLRLVRKTVPSRPHGPEAGETGAEKNGHVDPEPPAAGSVIEWGTGFRLKVSPKYLKLGTICVQEGRGGLNLK